jgi:hypothetical protein
VASTGPQAWLPFILDLEPHLEMGDTSPDLALRSCLARWELEERPHLVADSAFGSLLALDHLRQWGCVATMACASNKESWVWLLLSKSLPSGHWRAALIGQVVYSVTCSADPKGELHYLKVMSSGYRAVSFLSIFPAIGAQQQVSSMPLFVPAELKTMTVKQLRVICAKHNVKAAGKKDNIVQSIISRSNTLNASQGALRQLESRVPLQQTSGMGPPNAAYKRLFNSIDVADRYHARVKECHIIHSWRSKFLLNVLRCGVINSWVVSQNAVYHDWKDYRLLLAAELLKE